MSSTFSRLSLGALAPAWLALATPAFAAGTLAVTGQTAGPTVFIEQIALTTSGSSALASVQFTITPKQGSFTRPLSATYSAAYMIARGYWDGSSASLTIPVFGLYAGATNTVALTATFADGTTTTAGTSIATGTYADSCKALDMPISKVQRRKSTAELGYDFMFLKKYCNADSPTIMDTDGEIRWVATGQYPVLASLLVGNVIYKSDGKTGVIAQQWDGTLAKIADYKNMGVTTTDHHNFDLGRNGIIMDVDTTTETEAVDIEIDTAGKVLQTWDMGAIISATMKAGGDDPTQFTAPVGTDWFHNNSTTYNPADNTLIVSSRENFVMAVGYDDHKIKWIIGDTSKHWYQFASLRAFALKPTPNAFVTTAPVGQHGVQIDAAGNLRLFDDGYASIYQKPSGVQRNYSEARAYQINTAAGTYQQVFSYAQGRRLYAAICGSAYQDLTGAGDFLVDYPSTKARTVTVLSGVNAAGTQVFEYSYPDINACATAWNTQIVHLENQQF